MVLISSIAKIVAKPFKTKSPWWAETVLVGYLNVVGAKTFGCAQ